MATCLLGLFVSGALLGVHALADPPQGGDPEIVVMARRMQLIEVEYAVRGNWLVQCAPRQSTGSPAADRMICVLLAQCLREGQTGTKRAKACLNGRIHALAQGGTPEPAGPAPWQEAPPAGAMAPPGPVTTPSPSPALEIVVSAKRAELSSGLWDFTELTIHVSSTDRNAPPLADHWQACVSDGDREKALARALEFRRYWANDPVPHACRAWKVRRSGKSLTGTLSCTLPSGATFHGKLTGALDDESLEISRVKKFIGGGGRGKFATTTSELSGRRLGLCGAD
ncbi:hypothetical protein HT136_13005 [Novosphingobium profundi]|uniref:DUF3617 domain-containing protein n=1 Tax=Novosphingobium profundi TaxID=1774954 RepID=UPI001BDA8163|nr:hypothetical protein [Novosphingobium profundi]MBT0669283.1 hypothetical protein [Novosphingobium profundi]